MTALNSFDPGLFDPKAISEETEALNRDIVEQLTALPDMWKIPLDLIRQRRSEGKGPIPAEKRTDRARMETIPGPAGELDIRIIAPDEPRGVYLHFHGGGWVLGATDEQDQRHLRLADTCGLAVVSVGYRLAPENPYPAGPDDCEAAALWLAGNAREKFGTDRLMIGGESAGAHLSVVTLARLRDRHGLTPFCAANLVSGCYDLGHSPSARNWGEEKLILNFPDIVKFHERFLPEGIDRRDPDVSPLYADLAGLPPALFTVGTRDPLVDDTLFMATRWMAANGNAALEIYPGGAHVFVAFPGALAEAGLARMDSFLNQA